MLAQLVAWMLMAGLIAGLSYSFGTVTCESKAGKMALPYSYGLIEGCMVQVDGHWVPLESYRVID